MKKILLLSFVALVALIGCKKSEEASNVALKLNQATVVLNQEGKTTGQLSVLEPSQYASDKRLVWTSDKPKCVTVDQNGLITAVSPGTANIFVYVKGLDAVRGTCKVVVAPSSTAELTMEAERTTFNVGDTVFVTYSYDEDLVGADIDISSSDTIGRPLIDCYGVNGIDSIAVVGIAPGRVCLTMFNAYNPEISDSIVFTVVETPVESFAFESVVDELQVGSKAAFSTVILPSAAANTPVKWSVDDSYCATIDQDGVLTALNAGVVAVRAATNFGTVLSHDVTITDPIAKDFGFAKKSINISIGNGFELLYPLSFILNPEHAENPTVEVANNYVPQKGAKSDVSTDVMSGTAVVFAPHTDACIGSAALVAYNGSKDKDGNLITDTCIVNVINFSSNVLAAKAVYDGTDLGSKIAVKAKFTHFLTEPIIVKKVELVRGNVVVQTLTPNQTINTALETHSFDFTPVAGSAAQVKQYSVRYNVVVGYAAIESTFTRPLVLNDGIALVKGAK